MSDQQITCSECGSVFVFKEAEQAFYAERGLAYPPKRCRECRQARKAQQGGPGGPPRDRDGRGGDRPFRGGGGGGDRPRGPGGPGGGDRPRGGGGFERPPRSFDGPPRGGFDRPRGDRPQGFSRDRRDDRRAAPPRFDRPPPRADGPRATWGSPNRDAPPPREAQPARAEKPPRARPERPRYDITCAECGAAAQVPFKPLEGRQVFCQPCYRARKATAQPTDEPPALEGDAGIVE